MNSRDFSAFQQVRPYCIELSRFSFLPRDAFDPSSEDLLKSLKDVEHQLDILDQDKAELSTNFADYVFVPIASLLKQESLGEKQVEYLLLIISHLLSLCWSTIGSFPKPLAKQLFPLVTFLISNEKDNHALKVKTLEFKLAGSKALKNLYNALAVQKLGSAYDFFSDVDNLPSLGHSITILLEMLLENPHEVFLQLKILEALNVLYLEAINDGEILSFVLPGNVSTFAKMITKPGITANYKVVSLTLDLFASLLSVVYNDSELHVIEHTVSDLKEIVTAKEVPIRTQITIDESEFDARKYHRNNKWLRATSAQVKIALESMIPRLLKRNNEKINEHLIRFTSTVLKSCAKSLDNCQNLLVSTILDVRSSKGELGVDLTRQLSCIEQIVNDQLSSFAKLIQFEDSNHLDSLSLSIRTLHSNGSLNDLLIHRTVMALYETVSDYVEQKNLRIKDVKISEQSNAVIISNDFNTSAECHYLLVPNFSKSMLKSLCQLVNTVGICCDAKTVENIVDSLLSSQEKDKATRKPISLWISSELIKGYNSSSEESREIDSFINFDSGIEDSGHLPLDCYYNTLECSNDLLQQFAQAGVTVDKSIELSTTVALDTIKTLSRVMGNHFRDELIDYLYPVVDCLASSSPKIRQFAQSATLAIAQELYAGSVHDLILNNTDYLVDAISVRLNSSMTQRVATVLMVICKIAGYGIIQSFRDVLETIFKLLDYYHGYSDLCLEFFQLFEAIVLEMQREYLNDSDTLKLSDDHILKSSFKPWGITSLAQMMEVLDKKKDTEESEDTVEHETNTKDFEEYFNKHLTEVDSDDEDADADEVTEETKEKTQSSTEAEWHSPIPHDSYKLLLQIVNYGDRLLTHPSKPLKVKILGTMKKIVPMLATQHGSLLPQIANLWNIVVECALNQDFSIAKVAYECLFEMIHYSGDFITKRFIDLWATLKNKSILLRQVFHTADPSSFQGRQLSTPRKFPPITRDALIALSEMLLEGISVTELLLPDNTLEEMVCCCILVVPRSYISSKSLCLADVASGIVRT